MVSHDDDDEDNFYLHIDPTVDHEKLSDFELSNCKCNKKKKKGTDIRVLQVKVKKEPC